VFAERVEVLVLLVEQVTHPSPRGTNMDVPKITSERIVYRIVKRNAWCLLHVHPVNSLSLLRSYGCIGNIRF
jgi:hypothetical protein